MQRRRASLFMFVDDNYAKKQNNDAFQPIRRRKIATGPERLHQTTVLLNVRQATRRTQCAITVAKRDFLLMGQVLSHVSLRANGQPSHFPAVKVSEVLSTVILKTFFSRSM